MAGPLEGIRVLEWAIWLVGPSCCAMLGDMGADIIKIEQPVLGDPARGMQAIWGLRTPLPGGGNILFEGANRNARSITIDLSKEQGRELVYKLVKSCDVFVHNFRRGVVDELGMDYQTLSRHNPKLVYAWASGYGSRGPDSDLPALDTIGQARSGFMLATGEPDMPPLRAVGAISDQTTANMLSYAILAGLLARERMGIGQEIDISMLGSMVFMQNLNANLATMRGREFSRRCRAKAGNPMENYYRCQDGKWLLFAHTQADEYWHDFCEVVGIQELEHDPRFENMQKRLENCEELIRILDGVFATKTREEWLRLLKQKYLFYGPVNTIAEAIEDPQVIENEYIQDFDHPVLGPVKMARLPINFSKTPARVRSAA
ncbi:MAG: CaiB/BaiF CoA transferase family protein, partial [Dehalococcoidia bacterium]